MGGGRGKANSLSFVYSTLLQNVGASSLQRYIKNKNKTKITDSKNNEKEKVVMQTLARNENKSTCLCDLNSCFRWGTNFTRNFSATNVERFHVSMSSDTIHKDNGRRIVDKKAVESKALPCKQFVVEADIMFCAKLSSYLAWGHLPPWPQYLHTLTAIHDCFSSSEPTARLMVSVIWI